MSSTPWNLGRIRLSVALRTLERGECSSPEPVAHELAVVVLTGRGRLVIDGASQRFSAPCSLIPHVGSEYRLVNDAAESLTLLIAAVRPNPVASMLHASNRRVSPAPREAASPVRLRVERAASAQRPGTKSRLPH
jgi:hypothetical protein